MHMDRKRIKLQPEVETGHAEDPRETRPKPRKIRTGHDERRPEVRIK